MPPTRTVTGHAKRATSATASARSNPAQCEECGIIVCRAFDLPRHILIHKGEAGKEKLCPYPDCNVACTQSSNLATHIRNTHTKDKRYICRDDPDCDWKTSDPAAFTRHRKTQHGYVPMARANKRSETRKPSVPRKRSNRTSASKVSQTVATPATPVETSDGSLSSGSSSRSTSPFGSSPKENCSTSFANTADLLEEVSSFTLEWQTSDETPNKLSLHLPTKFDEQQNTILDNALMIELTPIPETQTWDASSFAEPFGWHGSEADLLGSSPIDLYFDYEGFMGGCALPQVIKTEEHFSFIDYASNINPFGSFIDNSATFSTDPSASTIFTDSSIFAAEPQLQANTSLSSTMTQEQQDLLLPAPSSYSVDAHNAAFGFGTMPEAPFHCGGSLTEAELLHFVPTQTAEYIRALITAGIYHPQSS